MAIKYQLQNSLFKGKYFVKEDNDWVRVSSTEDIKKLTSVLEYLQKMISTLQDIKVSVDPRCSNGDLLNFLQVTLSAQHCIVFSPSEYRRVYCNFLDEDNCGNGASVLKTLKTMTWTRVQDYPTEWQDPLPQYCMCTGSCFTK